MPIEIQPEQPDDLAAIFAVHAAAFPAPAEAKLVDRLRDSGQLSISLVAAVDNHVVGNIAFSPVTIGLAGFSGGLGLAPLGVLPAQQRRGIGTRLVEDGIERCRALGASLVVVLGDPDYYGRFGFETASRYALGNEYGAEEAFMVLPLIPAGVPAHGGLVRYSAPFGELGE